MPDTQPEETEGARFERMRANRDLWVRRHMELESLIRTIRAEIERFEEGVEHKGEWRYECSADDLMCIGWARVLCDMAFGPPMNRPEGHLPPSLYPGEETVPVPPEKQVEEARFYFVHRSELEGMADTDPDEGYVALVDADLLAASEEREKELREMNARLASRESESLLVAGQERQRAEDQIRRKREAQRLLSSHREALREVYEAASDTEGPVFWEAIAKARALLSDQPKEEGTTEG